MNSFSRPRTSVIIGIPIALLIQLGCDREKGPNEIVPLPNPPATIIKPLPTELLPPPSDNDAIALSAENIIKENCSSCHNQEQRQGNFGIVEDVTALIASGRYVVPGQPENSLLFSRLRNMPPGRPLEEDKKELLFRWISSLEEKKEVVKVKRSELASLAVKHITDEVPESQRRGVRFFSLHNMYNAQAADSDVQVMKKGFLKVLNSVSLAPKVLKPTPIDKSELLFPVHLPSLGISTEEFDNIIAEHYPYCPKISFLQTSEKKLRQLTGSDSKCSIIRMDWFTATAPLPKVYSKLLKQGATRIALDEQLGVDLIENINSKNNVIRSGFRNSGVSSQSRIIERHLQAKNGLPYWISYDFAALDGKGNIFANPIGPNGIDLPNDGAEVSDKVFEHDGGEVIYQLPNGLFGYYLADSAGGQIDKGPTQIVKQEGAPEQFVSAIVNGISCMSCHGSGLIHKEDQIGEFAQREENEDQFSVEEKEFIRRLYVQDFELQRHIAHDNEAYFEALKKLEIDYSKGDPVNDSFRIYNRSLTLNQVVAELDLETSKALNTILSSSAVKFIWANLNEVGAFLSREEFNLGISALSNFELTRLFEIPAGGDYVITPNCMSKNPLLMNECFIGEGRSDEAVR